MLDRIRRGGEAEAPVLNQLLRLLRNIDFNNLHLPSCHNIILIYLSLSLILIKKY